MARSQPKLGGVALAALIAAPLLVAFLAFVVTEAADFASCGGDNGLPYAAPSSAQGRFCDGSFTELKPLFVLAPAAVVAAAAAVFGRRRRWWLFGLTSLAGLALAFAPAVVMAALDEDCPWAPDAKVVPIECYERAVPP